MFLKNDNFSFRLCLKHNLRKASFLVFISTKPIKIFAETFQVSTKSPSKVKAARYLKKVIQVQVDQVSVSNCFEFVMYGFCFQNPFFSSLVTVVMLPSLSFIVRVAQCKRKYSLNIFITFNLCRAELKSTSRSFYFTMVRVTVFPSKNHKMKILQTIKQKKNQNML